MADSRVLLATLPLVAATMARKREAEPLTEDQRRWWNFRAVAPTPVWRYVMDVDAEATADPAFRVDTDEWLHRYHPALENVVDGLLNACHEGLERLRHTQGCVVKWAEWRLGYWFAKERAAGATATVYDRTVRETAARALLGWSDAESKVAWQTPELYLDRWRSAATNDPDIRTRSGLHRAELALLESEPPGEQEHSTA